MRKTLAVGDFGTWGALKRVVSIAPRAQHPWPAQPQEWSTHHILASPQCQTLMMQSVSYHAPWALQATVECKKRRGQHTIWIHATHPGRFCATYNGSQGTTTNFSFALVLPAATPQTSPLYQKLTRLGLKPLSFQSPRTDFLNICAQAVHTLTTQPHPIPLGFPFLRDALFCSSSSWLGM